MPKMRKEIETIEEFRASRDRFISSHNNLRVDHLPAPVTADQFLLLLTEMEKLFPGEQLQWLSRGKSLNDAPSVKEFHNKKMTDREASIREFISTEHDPPLFSVSNGKRTPDDCISVDYFFCRLSKEESIYDIGFLLPISKKHDMERIIEISGDVLKCYCAKWMMSSDEEIIQYQLFNAWCIPEFDGLGRPYPRDRFLDSYPKLNLPKMIHPARAKGLDIKIPDVIGWVNYWSPETCEILGFPNSATDERLLQLSHRTVRGAWLVKLTEEIFDVTRPEHVETLEWAYRRFYKIGMRAEETRKRRGQVLHNHINFP
jgi:hypothetical protein